MTKLRPVGYYDLRGKSHCGDPNLHDVISETPDENEENILNYLQSGFSFAGCGGVERDVLNPTKEVYLNLDAYSDGVWHWPACLAYYVKNYHARLPKDFIAHMQAN